MSKKEVIIYVLILLAIILVRSFVVTPIKVNGDSMNDTLKNGEIIRTYLPFVCTKEEK